MTIKNISGKDSLCLHSAVNPLVWPIIAGAPTVVIQLSLKRGSANKFHESIKISLPLLYPFNGKVVSTSSLDLMSPKTILVKTHIWATSAKTVDSSNWRKKLSHASMSLSCSSTSAAIPLHRRVTVFLDNCTSLITASQLYC